MPIADYETLAELRRFVLEAQAQLARAATLLKAFDDGRQVDADDPHNWQDYLVFNYEVSTESPVVRGTTLTASRIVAMVNAGWSWADIITTRPVLTMRDIRACLAYHVAQGGEKFRNS